MVPHATSCVCAHGLHCFVWVRPQPTFRVFRDPHAVSCLCAHVLFCVWRLGATNFPGTLCSAHKLHSFGVDSGADLDLRVRARTQRNSHGFRFPNAKVVILSCMGLRVLGMVSMRWERISSSSHAFCAPRAIVVTLSCMRTLPVPGERTRALGMESVPGA